MKAKSVAFAALVSVKAEDIKYSFDPATSGGVTGSITVKYLSKGAEICADLDVSKADWNALKKFDGNCSGEAVSTFKWHIHTVWKNTATSGFLSQCSLEAAGNHYDPLFSCGPASEHVKEDACKSLTPLYNCTSARYKVDPDVCEKGDLSGKMGAMKALDGKISQTWVDQDYPNLSENAPQWNMMLHAVCGNSTPRFICATGHNNDSSPSGSGMGSMGSGNNISYPKSSSASIMAISAVSVCAAFATVGIW